jgi:hypothetical protein
VTIALDASPLTVSTGGVGRYTLELALALAAEYPNDQYWLLSDQVFSPPSALPPNLHTGEGPRNQAERKWWLWGLEREMRRRGVSLFHGTDYSVPYDCAQRDDAARLSLDGSDVAATLPGSVVGLAPASNGLATMYYSDGGRRRASSFKLSRIGCLGAARCSELFVRLPATRLPFFVRRDTWYTRISPACWMHGGGSPDIADGSGAGGAGSGDSPYPGRAAWVGKFPTLPPAL